MKSLLFTFSFLLLFSLKVKAQVFSGNKTLTSQVDVNSFGMNYISITGNLIITGVDIANLDALSTLDTVGGNLDITGNGVLTSISGLSNVSFVGGDIYVESNGMLTNVDGFPNISSVVGELFIDNNASLLNLDGLSSIYSVGWNLIIQANSMLQNVDGLYNISSVEGNLTIRNNMVLTHLNGLSNVSSIIGGSLTIDDNPAITNIDGISKLSSGGDVSITVNISLNDISDYCGLYTLFNSNWDPFETGFSVFGNGIDPTRAQIVALGAACPTDLTLPSIAGRDGSICIGSSVDLATLITGIPLNSIEYGLAFGVYDLDTSLVTPTTTTTYYLRDSTTGTMLSDTAKITITVLPLPSIVGRDSSICQGDSIDLSTLITGLPINSLEFGTSYGVYNLVSSMVSPSIEKTYFVRDKYNALECADTTRITITPLSLPSVLGRDTTICAGESVGLSSLVYGANFDTLEYGTIYGIYNLNSSDVSPSMTTTYYVNGISNTTTCADTSQITLTVLSPMECLMNFYSSNKLSFGDPCYCDQALLIDGPEGNRYYFRDTLVVGAPSDLSIAFAGSGSSNMFNEMGQPLSDGTSIPEFPLNSGSYKMEFFKRNNIPAVGFVSVNGQLLLVQIDPLALEVCNLAENCPELVPTLGQWGLGIIALLIVIFGIVGIRAKSFRFLPS